MLNKIVFYGKMGCKLIRKDVINREDYRSEYDKVSKTYCNWLKEMGKFTDNIIKPEYILKKNNIKILDFACGTGYITKSLLKKVLNCEINAVDYSEKMLEQLKLLNDSRVKTINCDGIEFLKNTEEKYDGIFFGWALSYFNYKNIFSLFKKRLNPGGIVYIITNVQGTLSGIENIFLKVMSENQENVIKPMDIRFNLPKGKAGLEKWFKEYGFEAVEVEDGEVIEAFDTPQQLLQWLNETGAAAGTSCIFKDYESAEDKLIDEIRKEKYNNGKYEINHKFSYGVFKSV